MAANLVVYFIVHVFTSGAQLLEETVATQFPLPVHTSDQKPLVIPLRRESVPVKRFGKIVSYKTSYSGLVHMGTPPQEYRVVFDTGSGHLILPDARCETDACLNGKRSYDMNKSATGLPINSKGLIVPPGRKRPSVNIGFGTGGVSAQFVRDVVCVSPHLTEFSLNRSDESHNETQNDDESVHLTDDDYENIHEEFTVKQSYGMEVVDTTTQDAGCVTMRVLVAMEMSTNPFYYFNFDGILGLGMKNLAVQDDFSFFDVLSRSPHISNAHFGVYLTEGEDPKDEAQIAFGGLNAEKVLEDVSWSPVVKTEIGYWQVRILAVRVGGVKLDICDDGTCRGVVDTGTSHLGLPVPWNEEINELLTRPAEDYLDCRLQPAPTLEFELDTKNLSLSAWNYMRRLPIREGIQVGSTHGVSDAVVPSLDNTANGSLVSNNSNETNDTNDEGNTTEIDLNATNVTRFCRPRTMAVNLSEPVGPKFFILGEPVLHKYYTLYDWQNLNVGFALANNAANRGRMHNPADRGVLPDDVELLMQKRTGMLIEEEEDEDDTVMLQMVKEEDADYSWEVRRMEVLICYNM